MPEKPSVLHVISSTQRRGAEVLASELAPALDELGWPSTLVALAPAGSRSLDVPTLGARRLGPVTLAALRRRLRRTSVAIAHGSSTLPACGLASAGTSTPVVYRSVGDPRYWAPTAAKRIRTARLMGRCARVVALTAEAADALVDHYGLDPDRVVVIPKGVSADRLPPKATTTTREARRSLGLPDDVPVALYLGALSPEKNAAMAVDAAAAVPGLLLLVAGTGPDEAALRDRAAAIAPTSVRFLGDVADPGTALAAADLLVIPSHTEGMPGVAMEAGMVGLPVVTTDVGWVREIVIDGVTGVVVPPGDCEAFATGLHRALAAREDLGAAARARCLERFDIRQVAGRWASMLTDVVGDSSTC